MNLQRWISTPHWKLSLVAAFLWQRGCLPWTGRPSIGRNTKKGTRLCYSENITSGNFASRPRNRTFSFDDFTFAQQDASNIESKPPQWTRPLKMSRPPFPSSSTKEESIQHAMAQVAAILDLYELTPSISSDIATSTLDGLIGKAFQDRAHTLGNGQVLEDLESLVWRCGRLQIPLGTIMSLKMLLTMQRQYYESIPDKTDDNKIHFVERSSKLLLVYCQDSSRPGSFRWPNEDIRGVFRNAVSNHLEMTPNLWDLYRLIQNHHPEEDTAKDCQTQTLQVLAASGSVWNDRQFQILLDLQDQYETTNNTVYQVDSETLSLALQSSSRRGDVVQSTWLFRQLYKPQLTLLQKKQLWYLLIQAYAESNEPGSIPYMELLIETQSEAQHTDIYNLVLKALARQRTPGSGMHAEDFLRKMEALVGSVHKTDTMHPTMETAFHVVAAYLDEVPQLFQNVADTDALFRRLCSMYDLNKGDPNQLASLPVFEKILKAYATLSPQPKESRVTKAAESFFQFFLVQHRDGGIQEAPTASHLMYILKALNRNPNTDTAERSLEFFRLFEKLGFTKAETSFDVIDPLVDTLEKSGQEEYRFLSEEMLQKAQKEKQREKSNQVDCRLYP